ncbi:hypothetical protein J4476_05880 [Candidatus Woesearchaeota archaeon]|nr:MAG: hypothetical protein QT09_C0002G0042 [archaeon GW2011_AR18]MBS3162196.1 hypothetical protein [Candidatus Woesearchaeota archaeon]HIH26084.1 hypothetical protein [Nanoarchaeota archaeon]
MKKSHINLYAVLALLLLVLPVYADHDPTHLPESSGAGGGAVGGDAIVIPIIDTDDDTIEDSQDNCPINSNTEQSDYDNDGEGDICDIDDFLADLEIDEEEYNTETKQLFIRVVNNGQDDYINYQTTENLASALENSAGELEAKPKLKVSWSAIADGTITDIAEIEMPPAVTTNLDIQDTLISGNSVEYTFENIEAPTTNSILTVELDTEDAVAESNENNVYALAFVGTLVSIKSVTENLEGSFNPEYNIFKDEFTIAAEDGEDTITLDLQLAKYSLFIPIFNEQINEEQIKVTEIEEVDGIIEYDLFYDVKLGENEDNINFNPDGTATIKLYNGNNRIRARIITDDFIEDSISYDFIVQKENGVVPIELVTLTSISDDLEGNIDPVFNPETKLYSLRARGYEDVARFDLETSKETEIYFYSFTNDEKDIKPIDTNTVYFRLHEGENTIWFGVVQPDFCTPEGSCETVAYSVTITKDALLDNDGDLVDDNVDNCLGLVNALQLNADNDIFGDDCDNNPNLAYWDRAQIKTTGITNLRLLLNNVDLAKNPKYLPAFSTYLNVSDGDLELLGLTHDFNTNKIDLSRLTINLSTNYIGVDFDGQLQADETKTLYFKNNNFAKLCVKDAKVTSQDDISADCNQENEYDFTACLNNAAGITINSITCTQIENSLLQVSGLKNSGIEGTPTPAPSDPSPGGGGGGGRRSSPTQIVNITNTQNSTFRATVPSTPVQPIAEQPVQDIKTEQPNAENPITGQAVTDTGSNRKYIPIAAGSLALLGIGTYVGLRFYKKKN